MSEDLVNSIYSNMFEKETDELLDIWVANNREQYSDDAFVAIQRILTERKCNIPQQNALSHAAPGKRSTRVRRRTFVLSYLVFFFLSVLLNKGMQSDELWWLKLVLAIMISVGVVHLCIERLHDIDKSGWYSILILIPFINLLLLVVLVVRRGTVGDNQYGSDPTSS